MITIMSFHSQFCDIRPSLGKRTAMTTLGRGWVNLLMFNFFSWSVFCCNRWYQNVQGNVCLSEHQDCARTNSKPILEVRCSLAAELYELSIRTFGSGNRPSGRCSWWSLFFGIWMKIAGQSRKLCISYRNGANLRQSIILFGKKSIQQFS